ncbi:MAG TPA: Lrp/AsnC family transcriptional regulator [Jiangellaceae bacterium]|jgi:Lrp/AsnC family transcriptional regulator, leucine-responsive regulatory protein|nr:Lrp/AsnC family transcriptional regulator [Jiangellaceae bacterium]
MGEARGTLDRVDHLLVEALRARGRESYAELARSVGLSGPTVQERVRRLEERGVIIGYAARIRPEALGLGVTALIGVLLSDSASHDDVGTRLATVPEIEDCWFIAGDEAYMLKVRVSDIEALEGLLGRLTRLKGVGRTRTTVVLGTRWEGRLVPAVEP